MSNPDPGLISAKSWTGIGNNINGGTVAAETAGLAQAAQWWATRFSHPSFIN